MWYVGTHAHCVKILEVMSEEQTWRQVRGKGHGGGRSQKSGRLHGGFSSEKVKREQNRRRHSEELIHIGLYVLTTFGVKGDESEDELSIIVQWIKDIKTTAEKQVEPPPFEPEMVRDYSTKKSQTWYKGLRDEMKFQLIVPEIGSSMAPPSWCLRELSDAGWIINRVKIEEISPELMVDGFSSVELQRQLLRMYAFRARCINVIYIEPGLVFRDPAKEENFYFCCSGNIVESVQKYRMDEFAVESYVCGNRRPDGLVDTRYFLIPGGSGGYGMDRIQERLKEIRIAKKPVLRGADELFHEVFNGENEIISVDKIFVPIPLPPPPAPPTTLTKSAIKPVATMKISAWKKPPHSK